MALLTDAGCSQDVIEHVEAVERLASRLAATSGQADPDVVRAGALLHDIGRAHDQGPDHVPKGVALLQRAGVDARVVDCVARHMGSGVLPEQANAWGWPRDRSYVPERVEEKIVAHADNLTFGTVYRGVSERVDALKAQGLPDAAARVQRLHAGLERELGVDPDAAARELQDALEMDR